MILPSLPSQSAMVTQANHCCFLAKAIPMTFAARLDAYQHHVPTTQQKSSGHSIASDNVTPETQTSRDA